jgi:hypothetical protein
MDNFDIQYTIANYLESHDLGNHRLVSKFWNEVYRVHLSTRCFKCLKHSKILYSSNHCYCKVCPSCAKSRFDHVRSCALYKSIRHQKSHHKRIRIMYFTFLEYPDYLRDSGLLNDSYQKLYQLIQVTTGPFRDHLLTVKKQYELL